MLQEIAQEYQFRILAMEVMPDHIHLLLDCKPQFFISDMIKIMKGNLARQMFLAYPELKKELWGGHLWNPSYCAITVSDRSRDQVLAYIHRRTKGKRKEKSLTEIYEQVWEELAEIPDAKRRFNAAEHLVHTTKKNPARFDFDLRFPKMPSYLRRAAIQHALGSVSSYETRMDLWEKSGE